MLETDFKSCNAISDPNDSQTFVSNLAGNIQGVVQYNNEAPGINIADVCQTMITTSNPYNNMIELNKVSNMLRCSIRKSANFIFIQFL